MKQTDYNTMVVSCNLHPHGHKDGKAGPYNLYIGEKYLPEFLKGWPKTRRPSICIEQTEDTNNFTLIRVLFLRPGAKKPWVVAGLPMHRARFYPRKPGIRVSVRKRLADSIPHPIPTGQYTGTCVYDVEGWFAAYTFQAVTLQVQEKQTPKVIVTPGDKEYDDALADLKGAFPRNDGLERGRIITD